MLSNIATWLNNCHWYFLLGIGLKFHSPRVRGRILEVIFPSSRMFLITRVTHLPSLTSVNSTCKLICQYIYTWLILRICQSSYTFRQKAKRDGFQRVYMIVGFRKPIVNGSTLRSGTHKVKFTVSAMYMLPIKNFRRSLTLRCVWVCMEIHTHPIVSVPRAHHYNQSKLISRCMNMWNYSLSCEFCSASTTPLNFHCRAAPPNSLCCTPETEK